MRLRAADHAACRRRWLRVVAGNAQRLRSSRGHRASGLVSRGGWLPGRAVAGPSLTRRTTSRSVGVSDANVVGPAVLTHHIVYMFAPYDPFPRPSGIPLVLRTEAVLQWE